MIFTDRVLAPRIVASDDGTPELDRVVPDQLGEMARFLGEPGLAVIVKVNFVVPGIHRQHAANVSCCQVFTVRSTRMDELNVFAAEIVGCVVGCEFGELVVPRHVGSPMEGPEHVVALEQLPFNFLKILDGNGGPHRQR